MSLSHLTNTQESGTRYLFKQSSSTIDTSYLDDDATIKHSYALLQAFIESLNAFPDTPLYLKQIVSLWDTYKSNEFTNPAFLNTILMGYSGKIISSYPYLLEEDKNERTFTRAHLGLSEPSLDILLISGGSTDEGKFYINPVPKRLFSQAYELIETD